MSSVVQRWVQAFLGNVFSTLVATTNGLERQHQKLKYSHLNDTANGSLTDLLVVIVQSYVPSCHRRYYLALLFFHATRVATSIFVSVSHFQHVIYGSVVYTVCCFVRFFFFAGICLMGVYCSTEPLYFCCLFAFCLLSPVSAVHV